MDISNPQAFSSVQWLATCPQLDAIPEDVKPFAKECSVDMGKVLDAAKDACPKVAKMDKKSKDAVCQTVKSMVRFCPCH
jgi:hypothetical protein